MKSKHRQWTTVGKAEDLIPDCGVGIKQRDRHIALFHIPEMDKGIFAVSNFCPFSGVHIIARGIVGDISGEPVVATPLYKQHFSLLDGRCIEDPEVVLETWPARLAGGHIQLQLGAAQIAA